MTTGGQTGEERKEEAVSGRLAESAKRNGEETETEEGDKRKKKGDGDGVFLVWTTSRSETDSRVKSFADVDLAGLGEASPSRVNITPIKAGSSKRSGGLFPGAVRARLRLETPPETGIDARAEDGKPPAAAARKPIGHDQTAEFLRPVVKVNPKKTEEEKAREREAETERELKESASGAGMDQTAQVLSKAGKAGGAFSGGWGYKLGFLKPVNEQVNNKQRKEGFCTGPLPAPVSSRRLPWWARSPLRSGARSKPLSAGLKFRLLAAALAAAFSPGSPLSPKATLRPPRL